MTAPQFFLFRNRNKVLVDQFMERINNRFNNPEKDLSNSNQYSTEQLHIMRALAKMKEIADLEGSGFSAGFVTPDGHYYIVSNIEQDDEQYLAIQDQIRSIAKQRESFFDTFQHRVKITETEEGIQLTIEPEGNA
ncbi:MAG: hypothetical protein EBU08_07035 [Micrococcales bacterium]|nr:hypothetical protein [Micrococcales bacterium]